MHRRPKALTLLVLLVSATLGGGTLAATPAHAADDTAGTPVDERVVVIGTGGITWADVSPETTPELWAAATDGAVGNLVDRSVESSTCPADGWLAVSAGARAADAFNAKSEPCRQLSNPDRGDGPAVPAWDEYLAAVVEQGFAASPGTLGAVVTESGTTASAIGPGAALALATPEGVVAGSYAPLTPSTTPLLTDADLGPTVAAALPGSELVVVDVGSIRGPAHAAEPKPAIVVEETEEPEPEPQPQTVQVPGPTRAELHQVDVVAVDGQIGVVLDEIREVDPELDHTTVVIASLSEATTNARMQVMIMLGDGQEPGTLLSRSTRQAGYVQGTDVLPTVLEVLSLTDLVPRGTLVGSPVTSDGSGAPVGERVASLVDDETHALATLPRVERFFLLYCTVNLLLFGAISFAFSRRFVDAVAQAGQRAQGSTGADGPGAPPAEERPSLADRLAPMLSRAPVRVLTVLRAVSIMIAAIPVSTLLANLSPWWRTGAPVLTLTALVVAWLLAITALAVLPRWRTWQFGPVGVVATVTAVVLAVDVATGAHMQVSALMGIQPTVAGRFYGFNNTAFALFATTTVLVAAAVSNRLVATGHRRLAALAVLVIGAVAVILDGSPSIGADFGGPPSLVPAFAILALIAAGIRLSWRKVALVLGGAVVIVSGFALLDWMRPEADRTHLGRFVDTVLDGGLLEVVVRKLEANFRTLRNPLAIVGIAGIAVIVLVLGRPLRDASRDDGSRYRWLTEGAPLKQINNDAPMFAPGVLCVSIALGIGTLVNDSGVVILGVGLSVLVPLVAATYASWMLTLRSTTLLAANAEVTDSR